MTKYIPRELLEHFILKAGDNISVPQPEPVMAENIDREYVLMPQTSNYALGDRKSVV